MKRLAIYIVILAAVFASCKKQKANCSLTAARVLRYDCDRVVLQILDNSIAGDTVWTDIKTGISYRNVVSYHNTCAFNAATNNIGSEIYIEVAVISANPLPLPDCMQCQALSPAPPQTKIDMARFLSVPCGEEY